jgi:hypothetical protein
MNKADEFSQSFKRQILREDRDRLSTFLDHANSSVDDEKGGRFAAASPTRTVVGTGPISYPRLPADNPSNQAMLVPDEPPLGIDINAMERVGEIHEQKARPKSRLRRL